MSQTDQLAKPEGSPIGRIIFSWPVKLLGTLVCLWIISIQVNFKLMFQVLQGASIQWMLIGWALTVAVLICAIAEWGVLIRSAKHVDWGRLVAVYIRMLGPAQLLPAGIAGEAVRIYELSEQVGVATSSAAVALARLNSTLALATWALVGAILLGGSIGKLATAICGFNFLLMGVVWSISFWPRTAVDRVVLWLEQRHNSLIDKAIPFVRSLENMGHNHGAMCVSLLSSLIGWGINFSALSAFAFSIALTIMPTVFATALQLSLLATLIPFTMNGFGLREGILLNVLMQSGLPSSHAAIIAILVDLQLLPFVLISAVAWLVTKKSQAQSV